MIQALHYFGKAAQQGYKLAQFNIGSIQLSCSVVILEYDAVIVIVPIGVCFEVGMGTEKNLPKAIKFYKLAARQGHKDSQYRLGESC